MPIKGGARRRAPGRRQRRQDASPHRLSHDEFRDEARLPSAGEYSPASIKISDNQTTKKAAANKIPSFLVCVWGGLSSHLRPNGARASMPS